MSTPTVAIAGATGNLGPLVLKALLNASFKVVVLTREGSSSTSNLAEHPNQTIKKVDFSSVEDLKAALKGVDVVVSTITTISADAQGPLIDAAVQVGVKRFIPSEFGSDTVNPKVVDLPVFKGKVDTQKLLAEQVKAHPDFSYTLVLTGAFLDWGMAVGFVIDVKGHKATLYNGGDVPFSATNLSDIATAIVGVVNNLEATKNKPVYIQSALVTQNQLIKLAKKHDNVEWDTSVADTKEITKSSYASLAKGEVNTGVMYGFIFDAVFGSDGIGNFSSRSDNKLLGIKELSEDEIEQVIKNIVGSA